MRMQRNWGSDVLFSLVFTALLAACSSGGGDTPGTAPVVPAGTAEGLWTGTSDDGRTIAGAVLDDSSYWVLYSMVGQPTIVAGAVQGTGQSQQGAFTSSDGRDFNSENNGQLDVTISARYVMRKNLSGTLAYPIGENENGVMQFATRNFTSMFAPEYDATPDLTRVAGTYTGSIVISLIDIHSFTVTVSPTGAFTLLDDNGPGASGGNTVGIITGCAAAGTLSPRPQGNVYDITFTHTEARGFCHTNPYRGVAVLDGATNSLYILALDGNRRNVFPFLGTKQ